MASSGISREDINYASECSGCGGLIELSLPATVSRVATKNEAGQWVRCRCGKINWADKQNPGGEGDDV